MQINRSILVMLAAASASVFAPGVSAQIGLPVSAIPAANDTMASDTLAIVEAPLTLRASLSERMLYVQRGDTTLQTFLVAVGTDLYPTPLGSFRIKKIIWNPSWRPPRTRNGQRARPPRVRAIPGIR